MFTYDPSAIGTFYGFDVWKMYPSGGYRQLFTGNLSDSIELSNSLQVTHEKKKSSF